MLEVASDMQDVTVKDALVVVRFRPSNWLESSCLCDSIRISSSILDIADSLFPVYPDLEDSLKTSLQKLISDYTEGWFSDGSIADPIEIFTGCPLVFEFTLLNYLSEKGWIQTDTKIITCDFTGMGKNEKRSIKELLNEPDEDGWDDDDIAYDYFRRVAGSFLVRIVDVIDKEHEIDFRKLTGEV